MDLIYLKVILKLQNNVERVFMPVLYALVENKINVVDVILVIINPEQPVKNVINLVANAPEKTINLVKHVILNTIFNQKVLYV